MNRMRHILFFLPVAMLLAACSQDDSTLSGEAEGTLPEPIPLQLTAAIGEAVATPATRGTTVDGQWPTEGGTVYVQISETEDGFDDNKVLEYSVDASGNLTPAEGTETYYWTKNGQTIYVRAWYPGGSTDSSPIPKAGNTWTAETDQSKSNGADLAKSDFLYAYKALTFGSQPYTLNFSHLTCKITINLVNSTYLEAQAEESVKVVLATDSKNWYHTGDFKGTNTSLTLYESGDLDSESQTITPYTFTTPNKGAYATYQAIVIPQLIGTSQKKTILVTVGKATYKWEISITSIDGIDLNELSGGYEYTFNITVKEQGLKVNYAEQGVNWTKNTFEGTVTLDNTNE